MTMNTNRGIARTFTGNKTSRFANNPAQFIGIYLRTKLAEAALLEAGPQKSNLTKLNMACKWVRDPATGHMECFWQKTASDAGTLYV